MTLTFGTDATRRSFENPPGATWPTWAARHEPPARFVSLWSGRPVHGFGSPSRVGGVVAQPAELVLGIRSWEDAFEETFELEGHDAPVPYVLFEIEKIVRMMLHQSGLAFEILASPVHLVEGRTAQASAEPFPARRVVRAAVTKEIIHHYRDVAGGWLDRLEEAGGRGATGADALDIIRHALTGVGLMEGRAQLHIWTLVERHGSDALEGLLREVEGSDTLDPEVVEELCDHGRTLVAQLDPDQADLPDRPADYDWLDALVVALRRSASR